MSDAPTRIYLDHNASCPIAPEVAEAMRPFLERDFGNPSSAHWASAGAKEAIEVARAQVAAAATASISNRHSGFSNCFTSSAVDAGRASPRCRERAAAKAP